MIATLLLLADQPAGPDGSGGASPFGLLIPMLAVGILFWFFMIRPMKRQEQERQALLTALKKNDRVVTSGGIIGIVASIKEKEDEVTLKVDESANVRLRVTRGSIVRILGGDDAAKEQKESGA
jgi:preprotein translocase subunit YajC